MHGMNFSDGVEFDLRMANDGSLVIYHDEFVPGSGAIKERCIENLSSAELKSQGIVPFGDLIAEKVFTESWQYGGKTVDIEFKVPHPVTRKLVDGYLGSMMSKLEDDLEEMDLPEGSTLVSSFSPRIFKAAKTSQFSLPVTRLMPHIRSWGRYWKVKRAVAMPHFARSSIHGIARYLRKNNTNIMGIAVEYLSGWTRWINPGVPVGIKGRGRDRLLSALGGMGVFAWPAPLELEEALIGSGISLVSDEMDPNVIERPDGGFRWPRPASQPLEGDWVKRIENSSDGERSDLIEEARSSVASWGEIGEKRRRELIIDQGNKMRWVGSEEKWTDNIGDGIPWGMSRIIGHRGSGKTHGW